MFKYFMNVEVHMKRLWCLVVATTILTSTVLAASTQDKLNEAKNNLKDIQQFY